MREAFFSEARDPIANLLARILGEEPVQFGAVAVLQGAFDDERRGGLRVESREVVFLKERGEGGRDGHGYLTTNHTKKFLISFFRSCISCFSWFLYGLEYDLFVLENLHGVGLELIVACKSQIETDDALGFEFCHRADNFQCQFFFKTDQHAAACHAVD